ncbi:hypothetical protein [Caldicellulosiruptor acetigenus]|uniref:hypothetical protein n=1 Tax=Caldicellulosiruptor acetigenus TaxID=301953 RepID=UPI0001E9C489|nr:hypothetical protein [Caldicellulosiruptor acetigenus]
MTIADNKTNSYGIQQILSKLRKADPKRYQVLKVYGSKVKRIITNHEYPCEFHVKYESTKPDNRVYIYLIDRKLNPRPDII